MKRQENQKFHTIRSKWKWGIKKAENKKQKERQTYHWTEQALDGFRSLDAKEGLINRSTSRDSNSGPTPQSQPFDSSTSGGSEASARKRSSTHSFAGTGKGFVKIYKVEIKSYNTCLELQRIDDANILAYINPPECLRVQQNLSEADSFLLGNDILQLHAQFTLISA